MRGNEFLDKMKLIDAEFVEAADKASKRRKKLWVNIAAAAACVCLVLSAIVVPSLINTSDAPPIIGSSSPNNTTDFPGGNVGFGFEGLWAYDVSELVNANPWNEDSDISVLPIYKNSLPVDDSGYVFIDDANPINALKKEVEERLGELSSFAQIEVEDPQTVKVEFEEGIALPEEYNFKHYSSYEETKAVADYLLEEYGGLIAMKNPAVNISGGDYNIYGKQSYSISFFEGEGSDLDRIINYNFNQTTFYCDDEGKLWLIRVKQTDLSQKQGDYPIISANDAKQLLLNGSYVTTVPYEFKGDEAVAEVQLVYRTDIYEQYYIPYYRLLVEIEEKENGLKTYGAYYVPAVESKYIPEMPIWNGRFN